MSEHTPGPWTLRDDRLQFHIPEIGLDWLRSHSTEPWEDADIKASELGQRELANFRLIAAAPDLLAACQLGEKCLIDLAPYSPEVSAAVVAIVEIMHAAIRRAESPA